MNTARPQTDSPLGGVGEFGGAVAPVAAPLGAAERAFVAQFSGLRPAPDAAFSEQPLKDAPKTLQAASIVTAVLSSVEGLIMLGETLLNSASVLLESGGAAEGIGLEGANFAQKTFGAMFSEGGTFAGRSVADIAGALRSGAMKASDVPINFIVRDGNTLILNTRSAQALEAAGIPRAAWNAVNRTGQEVFEKMLSGQLQRNGLTSAGTAVVRQSGL